MTTRRSTAEILIEVAHGRRSVEDVVAAAVRAPGTAVERYVELRQLLLAEPGGSQANIDSGLAWLCKVDPTPMTAASARRITVSWLTGSHGASERRLSLWAEIRHATSAGHQVPEVRTLFGA